MAAVDKLSIRIWNNGEELFPWTTDIITDHVLLTFSEKDIKNTRVSKDFKTWEHAYLWAQQWCLGRGFQVDHFVIYVSKDTPRKKQND